MKRIGVLTECSGAERRQSAYTTRGNTRADALATSLYTAAQAHLPGHRLRTENFFMDSHPDCAFLLSPEGQQAIVDLHVTGITNYLAFSQ